ncbi:RFX DNA-binding domain-containing protein [Lipomyces doorenjongii]|uniref:RFX DNA-binding domain-containing protein n=1 Tax=Lipomyces doorenjongii TaxID=383834 RepID=UPI0034CE0582
MMLATSTKSLERSSQLLSSPAAAAASPLAKSLRSSNTLTHLQNFHLDQQLDVSSPQTSARTATATCTAIEPHLAVGGTAALGIEDAHLLTSVGPDSISQSHNMDTLRNVSPVSAASRKRKLSGQTEDPDQELRRHSEALVDRPLEELSQRVRSEDIVNSQSSASERSRQVFGLVWLMKTCQVSPHNAIPRNRIYARYAEICAHHKIKPLNPAAFGKLVKLLFPEIKTRRLGVRGKSKYHYCGINLIGDSLLILGPSPGLFQGTPRAEDELSDMRATPGLLDHDDSFEVVASEIHDSGTDRSLARNGKNNQGYYKALSLSMDIPIDKMEMHVDKEEDQFPDDPLTSLDGFTIPGLQFSKDIVKAPTIAFDSLALPSIDPFVPEGADRDSVDILTALCQSHCSSLLEAIRFMHLKQFLNTLASFHGTLTSPVQKLLSVPSILEWIQRCDWIMYKEMIRMLAPLALQIVPANVMSALRSLSMTLPQNIVSSFRSLPHAFIQVKLRPAYAFSNLIGRLLRVNDIANAAAKILANPIERRAMLEDWINYVDSKSIVLREAPCGGSRVLKILLEDVVNLLTVPREDEGVVQEDTSNERERAKVGTLNVAENDASPSVGRRHRPSKDGGDLPSSPVGDKDSDPDAPAEGIIERWAQYLLSLPFQFPEISARVFLLYMNGILTAALREITLNGGEAFGAWWMVRCWVDEWMAWIAEQGGFLSTESLPIPDLNEPILSAQNLAATELSAGRGIESTTECVSEYATEDSVQAAGMTVAESRLLSQVPATIQERTTAEPEMRDNLSEKKSDVDLDLEVDEEVEKEASMN